MEAVGIRELRQNLSRYVERVKAGEAFTVTERGREVARLTPSGESIVQRLVRERGATMPTGSIRDLLPPGGRPAEGPPSVEVLEALRAERM